MFENVNYDFYSDDLGRSVVPDVDSFNAYKMQNIQKMKRMLDYIEELEENGIDSSVCMMIEKDYEADQELKQSSVISSETVSGHSVSFDATSRNKSIELNSKSLDAKKLDCIRLFCKICVGVR